jgi:hypothetical protein
VRAAGLGAMAARVGRTLAAPRDLRASLVSWVNFIFLPEAVNRCARAAAAARPARSPVLPALARSGLSGHDFACLRCCGRDVWDRRAIC